MNASLLVQRRVSCGAYRQGAVGLNDFKAVVWRTTQALANVEDSDLRLFLQEAEGRLDMIHSQP